MPPAQAEDLAAAEIRSNDGKEDDPRLLAPEALVFVLSLVGELAESTGDASDPGRSMGNRIRSHGPAPLGRLEQLV